MFQTHVVVPVAGRNEMVQSSHLFSQKGKKGLSDDHIWFSVVASRTSNRFTRVQRLSCCLCLLFTAMIANAMFYGTIDSSTAPGFVIGPFSISFQQVQLIGPKNFCASGCRPFIEKIASLKFVLTHLVNSL